MRIVLALLSIITISAQAQTRTPNSLSGNITNAANEKLAGATVYVADIRLGTIADTNGYYIIRNIPPGHHLIEVSHAGYYSIIEHIDITGSSTKNFQLAPSIVENQGVVITGVSNATSIRKAPIPITSIRRDELLQGTSTNIIDALAKVPGVSQLSTGPGIGKPIIRGLGYNRVVVINDGVRQEGQQWGDEHGIEIDEASVTRAEILKGPASLMYGSDALAGVINLITNSPVQEGKVRGNILTNYQTNSNLVSLHGNIAGNIKGFNWNAYGTIKSAGDYENEADGKVLNSRFSERNFGGYFGVNKSWGFSHLIFSAFDQDLGLVEGDRDPATGRFILYAGTALERLATNEDLNSREIFIPKQGIQHYKLVSDNSFSFNRSRLKLNLGYQENRRKEFANPEDEEEAELFFKMRTGTYNLQFVFPESKEWHPTIGVSGMMQRSENLGEEALIPEYDLFDIGGFVYLQRFFNKLSLSGGVRYDRRSIDSKPLDEAGSPKFEAFTRSFSNFSASIGLSYEPVNYFTVKANIARGFRAPNLAELGSNGVHEGTFRYEYGDRDLKSETSTQLDAGLRVDYEHVSLGMNVFYNAVSDFIFYRKLESAFGGDSLVDVDGEEIPAFRFTQQDARLSGLELNVDVHPHPLDWLHFENSVSVVRGRFDEKIEGTDHLPLIPAHRWLSELRGDFFKEGKTIRNLYLKVEMEKNFDQDRPFFAYDTETATPGYTLLNAGLGFQFVDRSRKPIAGLHLSGSNLTNETYVNHLSRLKYAGVSNMGRNFSVKVLVPF